MALLTALITACGLTVATAGEASALGGETLLCHVNPTSLPYGSDCANNMGANSYQVIFWVQDETAPSTYAWSLSADIPSWTVTSGCTSTSNTCVLSVRNEDNVISASVTLTQNGATETLTSFAFVNQYCGNMNCA